MKTIDLRTYPRRDHFEHFLTMNNPFVSITEQLEISEWLQYTKIANRPVFLSFQYAVVHAANKIPELRRRIDNNTIVEYDFCDPSYTLLLSDGTYRYCNVCANQPIEAYFAEAQRKQQIALTSEHLTEECDPSDLLFISCIPWISYTDIVLPYPDNHFSNPCINWGKFVTQDRLCMEGGQIVQKQSVYVPVTLMVNHALADGFHIARFFENLRTQLDKQCL